MAARHITIGPEFFAKAKNDYASWHWAIAREFFQNCIDCGSTKITVDLHEEDGNTFMTVTNDGEPMTEEVLVEKLLSLGSSGKNFEGTTGGFGKAKEILYFCHDQYRIHSGHLLVEGSGASYDLTETTFYPGTRSSIQIDGCHAHDLEQATHRFIHYAQWDGVFVVNGTEKRGLLRKGSPRRDLGFAKVYTNRTHAYTMIVRINGTPMFSKGISLDRCVIVELKGQSDELLTSNRDGLVDPFCNELSSFVTELAVDKRSALKRRQPRYTQYRGTKMCHVRALNVMDVVQPMPEVEEPGPNDISPEDSAHLFGTTVASERARAAAHVSSVVEKPVRVASIGTNFILKNETELKVPAYYDPGSGEFSEYSRKLVRIWGRAIVEMHRLFDVEAEFSVGFILDDDSNGASEAEFERGDYGDVYYLNPCKVVEQSNTYSKSFKKRFKLTERDRLIMIALHEFLHAVGNGWHDENYANRLTDMAAVVMKNRKRFNWCFQ